ncbi:MAG: hypothetical protein OSB39_00875 [Opitutales bacterium]|nr:hypothetical protein [Opitutales bacterium]
MNPILASSLVTLGKDFIQSAFRGTPEVEPADSKDFDGMLSNAEKVKGSPESSPMFDRLGIKNVEDAGVIRNQLKTELFADPAVSAFMANNPDSQFYARRTPEGNLVLRATSGQSLTLAPDSGGSQLLSDYFDLSNFLGRDISPDRPGEILLKA